MKSNRIVVVGGGLTGLAAAVDAAARGAEVLVVERTAELGGRGRSDGPEGYALNLGPHALYPRAADLLARLGVRVAGSPPVLARFTMRIGDRVEPLPSSALTLLSNGALSSAGKWAVARVLATAYLGDPRPLDHLTVSEWLSGLPADARAVVQAVVRVTTYTNAPDRVPAGLAVRQIRSAKVRYLDGGWQSIASALEARARELGVTLRTQAKLDGIEHDGGVLRSVRIDGEPVACDGAILTLSPKACAALLGERAITLREFADKAVPVRAACLDVALRARPDAHPLDAPPPRDRLARASLVLGVDRPTYLSVHSMTARMAPEDGAVVHVARYLGPDERIDSAEVRRELEAELDFARPGWRERAVHVRWSPAMLVMHALPEVSRGGLAARPPVDATGIEGVRIAGDWVGPRGLLFDACLESARDAVESLTASARVERPHAREARPVAEH